ncbi:Coenzyme F420 hydrogenase/dehydrogenase, beta subunit C-terminal domain [candidate division KSB1 bacterium]|nr:Coenzyme F420 hydrogenase/dehydrogenase, beta subunit C-terminal domain [candidate division KSB1 bacterium]
MSTELSFNTLEKQVIRAKLCTHCGTCEGVCPDDAIQMDDVMGHCLPRLIGTCSECGACIRCCPGGNVNFSELTPALPPFDDDGWLGRYRSIWLAHAAKKSIRLKGASGGIGTALAHYLIRKKHVDAVVTLDFDANMPWIPIVKIISQPDHIMRAAQSKYFIYPQNRILRILRNQPVDHVAFFALPCQVHGLRKAIQNNIPGTEKIRYIIGLYCGNNLYYDATRSIFRRFGITDFNRIRSLSYRTGAYPGHFEVQYDQQRYRLDKFSFNYLSFFFTAFRCLYCTDLANELADISLGDAWRGTVTETDIAGTNVVIIRNPELGEIFQQGIKNDYFVANEISATEARRMHANVLSNKKIGAAARIAWLRRFKRPVPEYDNTQIYISFRRHVLEGFTLVLLRVLRIRIIRSLSHRISMVLIKPLMQFFRGSWRKQSMKSINKLISEKTS